jgi:hypothetical protein
MMFRFDTDATYRLLVAPVAAVLPWLAPEE